MPDFHHALGFHMHQPPGNLDLLARGEEWEAQQIMLCYERPLRYAERFADAGRFHVDFSGILLEQFLDPTVRELYQGVVDMRRMLDRYGQATNIELLATGYFHPIFPLIPEHDWRDQLDRSVQIMEELFGRRPKGFWPPEMAFSMEMIPALKAAGFEYVVVDHVHVIPQDEMDPEEAAAHPYLASHGDAEIAVIPRQRDLSNAQESGMAPDWLADQVSQRAARIARPALLTTWSDGENGGWFRQTSEEAGFWGHFYAPYMERVQADDYPLQPTRISDYLAGHPPERRATVRTGAWNVGTTGGFDFSQWAGSPKQKQVLEQVWEVSHRYRRTQARAEDLSEQGERALTDAHDFILRAETSCYFFWGESWTPKAAALVEKAEHKLEQVREELGVGPEG